LFIIKGSGDGGSGDGISSSDFNELKNDFEKFKDDLYSKLATLITQDEFDKLKQDVDDLRKKFEEEMAELHKLLEQFVKKPEFESYKNEADNRLRSHDDSISDIYKILEELKSKINNKLDCDTFDEHLADYNNLKNIVLNLAANKEFILFL
jgi:hypothetical protein